MRTVIISYKKTTKDIHLALQLLSISELYLTTTRGM